MRKEEDVKREIKRVFERHQVWYTMPHQSGYSHAGVPDFLACVRGHFLAVEAKFGTRRPTALQSRELNRIRAAGGTAVVVNDRNIDQLESLVYTLSERLT